MAPKFDDQDIVFDGSNWEDLERLVTRAKLAASLNLDLGDEKREQHIAALIAYSFGGAALDWYTANANAGTSAKDVSSPAKLVNQVQAHFGWDDRLQAEHRRQELADLRWDASDLPTFYADFTRLTKLLGIVGDSSRMMLLREKAPPTVWHDAAGWGIINQTYDSFRERTLCGAMIRGITSKPRKQRVKCGNCGKRGHSADKCRNPKK